MMKKPRMIEDKFFKKIFSIFVLVALTMFLIIFPFSPVWGQVDCESLPVSGIESGFGFSSEIYDFFKVDYANLSDIRNEAAALKEAGVNSVQLYFNWSEVLLNSDGTIRTVDDWQRMDAVVAALTEQGIEIRAEIFTHAPNLFESKEKNPDGDFSINVPSSQVPPLSNVVAEGLLPQFQSWVSEMVRRYPEINMWGFLNEADAAGGGYNINNLITLQNAYYDAVKSVNSSKLVGSASPTFPEMLAAPADLHPVVFEGLGYFYDENGRVQRNSDGVMVDFLSQYFSGMSYPAIYDYWRDFYRSSRYDFVQLHQLGMRAWSKVWSDSGDAWLDDSYSSDGVFDPENSVRWQLLKSGVDNVNRLTGGNKIITSQVDVGSSLRFGTQGYWDQISTFFAEAASGEYGYDILDIYQMRENFILLPGGAEIRAVDVFLFDENGSPSQLFSTASDLYSECNRTLSSLISGQTQVNGNGQETPTSGQQGLFGGSFSSFCSREGGLGTCIANIYTLSLGLAALLAVFMIILAGYKYMTAHGNASQTQDAKDHVTSALIGLLIIFTAFILLSVINPDLVRFQGNFGGLMPLPGVGTYQPPSGECRQDTPSITSVSFGTHGNEIELMLPFHIAITLEGADPSDEMEVEWRVIENPTGWIQVEPQPLSVHDDLTTQRRTARLLAYWDSEENAPSHIGERVRVRVSVYYKPSIYCTSLPPSSSEDIDFIIVGYLPAPIPVISGRLGTPEERIRTGDAVHASSIDSIIQPSTANRGGGAGANWYFVGTSGPGQYCMYNFCEPPGYYVYSPVPYGTDTGIMTFTVPSMTDWLDQRIELVILSGLHRVSTYGWAYVTPE